MITFSIIRKSQLEGAQRLDAEYYQPEYLESADRLDKLPRKALSEIAQITDGNHLTIAEQFVNSGTRYLRGKDLQDFFISDSDPMYIPDKLFPKLKRSHIFKRDVLVSIVGTVGLVSIVADDFERLTGSCKIAILHVKSVNPWVLAGFFLSRYGQDQLQRKIAGAVQTGIILKDLSDIVVPVFSDEQQEKIKGLLEQSYSQISESESLYLESEKLLLQELGLADFQIPDDLTFEVKFSEVKNAGRMDADYFQPKYESIINALRQTPVASLLEQFNILRSRSFLYNERGEIGVVQTKQLGKQFIDLNTEEKTTKEVFSHEHLPSLQNNDVVFASMGVGSLGKTDMFYGFESEGSTYTIDSTLKIFRSKLNNKVLPEVLTVFLSSKLGQELIYKYIVGSSGIISIYDKYLGNFLIPVLPQLTQQKIAELVRKSHEAHKKSKELLEEAKRKVEEMIEGKCV